MHLVPELDQLRRNHRSLRYYDAGPYHGKPPTLVTHRCECGTTWEAPMDRYYFGHGKPRHICGKCWIKENSDG